jgi:hypothetical protein
MSYLTLGSGAKNYLYFEFPGSKNMFRRISHYSALFYRPADIDRLGLPRAAGMSKASSYTSGQDASNAQDGP